MGITESRSPRNSSPNDPRRAESPGSHSNPSGSNYRNDGGGHLSGHVGKAASSPTSLSRRDAVPVMGGKNTTHRRAAVRLLSMRSAAMSVFRAWLRARR
jgi:hypothetical protein